MDTEKGENQDGQQTYALHIVSSIADKKGQMPVKRSSTVLLSESNGVFYRSVAIASIVMKDFGFISESDIYHVKFKKKVRP